MMTFNEARTEIRQTLCLYIMLGSKVRGQLIIVKILQRIDIYYLLDPRVLRHSTIGLVEHPPLLVSHSLMSLH